MTPKNWPVKIVFRSSLVIFAIKILVNLLASFSVKDLPAVAKVAGFLPLGSRQPRRKHMAPLVGVSLQWVLKRWSRLLVITLRGGCVSTSPGVDLFCEMNGVFHLLFYLPMARISQIPYYTYSPLYIKYSIIFHYPFLSSQLFHSSIAIL